MALRDVKQYYCTMLNQYLEMKDCMKDFEEAFSNGHISEDQLTTIKDDFAALEANYNRLSYIMFLLSKPNRRQKLKAFSTQNKSMSELFIKLAADDKSVELENTQLLKHFKEELERLTKE